MKTADGVRLGLVALALGLVAGCAERERISVPTDASSFTERGWTFFSEGNLEQALQDFENAIEKDASFGPAHVGLGWSRLGLATSAAAMETALSAFAEARTLGEGGAEVRAGQAAAQLGVGGSAFANAVTEAQAARAADPDFQFEHRPSFDTTDLFLIEAFARAAQGDIAGARVAADQAPVGDSGIDAGAPGTWTVDGVTFSTFEGAVLAFLHKLSQEHAG